MLLEGILVLFELAVTALLLTFGVNYLQEGERLRDFPILLAGLCILVLGGVSLGMWVMLFAMKVRGLVP